METKTTERDYDYESMKRAKRTVLELALNNSFDWFITFTFHTNGSLINDRKDFHDVKKKFLRAIQNYNRDFDTRLSWIAVPELHTNRQGIHFHCLMKGLDTVNDFKFTGFDKKTGRAVFKSTYFKERFGANRGIRIFDYNKSVAYYVSKYITKKDDRIFFHRYFRSRDLEKSFVIQSGLAKTYMEKDLIPTFENGLLKLYEFVDLQFIEKYIKEIQL